MFLWADWAILPGPLQEAEQQEREKLRQEWVEQQEKIKSKSLQLLS